MKKNYTNITIIYMFGQILTKAAGFLLIPLYTSNLGQSGYGMLSLVDMIYGVIGVFIICSINSGYIRFYSKYNDEDRVILKNTVLNFSLICATSIFFINFFITPLYSNKLFNIEYSSILVHLIFLRAIFEQFSYQIIINYSLEYRAKEFTILEFIKFIMSTLIIIFNVSIFNMGIHGIYLGYVIVNIIIFIYLSIINRKEYKFQMNLNMLKECIKFSCGYIPSNLSGIVLTLADRYILNMFMGLNITGIYSLAYKIGMLIEPLYVTPFTKTFTPYKYKVFEESKAEEKLNKWFLNYNLIGISIVFFISINSKFIISIISDETFISAYKIVPLILISYFLFGKLQFFRLGIQIKNKTYYDGFIMVLCGVINLILNFITIPKFNMYGAAISTVISYIIMNILQYYFSKKLVNIKYIYNDNIIKMYIISTILLVINYYIVNNVNNIIYMLIINILTILLWIFAIIVLNIVDINHFKVVFKSKLYRFRKII